MINVSRFSGLKFRTKAEIESEKLDAEIKEAESKISALEKKMLHRTYVRNAGLQAVQADKKELLRLRGELTKLRCKLNNERGIGK